MRSICVELAPTGFYESYRTSRIRTAGLELLIVMNTSIECVRQLANCPHLCEFSCAGKSVLIAFSCRKLDTRSPGRNEPTVCGRLRPSCVDRACRIRHIRCVRPPRAPSACARTELRALCTSSRTGHTHRAFLKWELIMNNLNHEYIPLFVSICVCR